MVLSDSHGIADDIAMFGASLGRVFDAIAAVATKSIDRSANVALIKAGRLRRKRVMDPVFVGDVGG